MIANVEYCHCLAVSYTPGGLSSWGRNSPVNASRSSVNYIESTSSSPRSDRRDMDSGDRRRYRGYAALCVGGFPFTFVEQEFYSRVATGQEMVREKLK